MRRRGLLTLLAASLLSAGCAIAPHGRGDSSVTHDAVEYLNREWPLAGPPVIPPDACFGGCSCCGDGCSAAGPQRVWADDWDQEGRYPISMGYSEDPPPAVPLDAGPQGRFFPAPVRPVFAPQGPPVVGIGTNAKAAG